MQKNTSLSLVEKKDQNYVISVDPSIDEVDSPSYGYIYVADMTKTPMEILETYQITKNGLKKIETPSTSDRSGVSELSGEIKD